MTDQFENDLDTRNGVKHGCHLELDDGESPDGCVLDYGQPRDCDLGTLPSGQVRRSKWTCEYWRPVKETRK